MSKCKERTEVYSRIVGYFRPVQQWNKGKRHEYEKRRTFQVEDPNVLEFKVKEYAPMPDKRVSGNVAN